MGDICVLLLGETSEALADRLSASGYSPLIGESGLQQASQGGCELVVLSAEWGARIQELRTHLGALPMLLDIVEDSVPARSQLLIEGGDDFWLSSAGASDLLTRLRVHLKLQDKQRPPRDLLQLGDLSIVPSRHEVRRNGQTIALTAREYALLELLMRHAREVVSRERILATVWRDQQGAASNVIEVYVRYLRQKLETGGGKRLIHTVRGRGYCLSDGPPQLG
jgi:two-component system, OmpR family, response regulator MprA